MLRKLWAEGVDSVGGWLLIEQQRVTRLFDPVIPAFQVTRHHSFPSIEENRPMWLTTLVYPNAFSKLHFLQTFMATMEIYGRRQENGNKCSCAGDVVQVFGFKTSSQRSCCHGIFRKLPLPSNMDPKSLNPNVWKLQLSDAINDQSSQRRSVSST